MSNLKKKIQGILKKLVKWLLIIIVVCSAYEIYSRFRPAYIVGLGGQWKERIPQNIVFFRDCEGYRDYVHSIIKPFFIPSDACPWESIDLNQPAEFKLGDNIYKVPRDYLWSDKATPSGEYPSIHLMMKYPDMEPGLLDQHEDGYGGPSGPYHIWVTVRDASHLKEKTTLEKNLELYYRTSFILYCVKDGEQKYCPKQWEYLEDIGVMDVSREFKGESSDTLFVEGDPYNPTHWVECRTSKGTVPNPGCETRKYLEEEDIIVRITFRRKWLFDKQKEILPKVIAKIRELKQINKGSENE